METLETTSTLEIITNFTSNINDFVGIKLVNPFNSINIRSDIWRRSFDEKTKIDHKLPDKQLSKNKVLC